MDLLLCVEKLPHNVSCCAKKDRNVLEDERVLQHLLLLEQLYVPHCDYLKDGLLQSDIQPFMRKIVTKWMLEVCDELNCEDQVFPLAVNMLDRFLCICDTPKKFLQLVAADCILMASKLRQAVTIPIDTLCYYTNYSVNAYQLRKYELLLVTKLNWDLLGVTAFDFIDHILQRIKWTRHNKMIRRHSLILLHLCYTEYDFMRAKPSTIATACIIAAIKGLKIKINCEVFRHICMLTTSPVELIEDAVNRIEWIVAKECLTNTSEMKSSSEVNCSENVDKEISNAGETPTEVQDVTF